MSVRKAYDQWSETYDTVENFTRDLDAVATRNALSHLSPERVLEIGCGTGKNTKFLAKIAKHVFAIDFSHGMMTLARSQVQSGNVIFSLANITQKWPCKDHSIDLVVCCLVLEHVEDLKFVFAEAARSLVDKGNLFISELHPYKQYQGIKANFLREGERTEIQAFVHHISDFLQAARENGFILEELKEMWHEVDQDTPPRLVTFMFKKC